MRCEAYESMQWVHSGSEQSIAWTASGSTREPTPVLPDHLYSLEMDTRCFSQAHMSRTACILLAIAEAAIFS